MGLALIVVYERGGEWVYSRYEGRAHTHRWLRAMPLAEEWVQELRNDPGQFDEDQTEPEAA